jgi:hypothetical protein
METITITDKSIFDKKTYNMFYNLDIHMTDNDYDKIFKKYSKSDYVDAFFEQMKLYKNKKSIELPIGYNNIKNYLFFFPENCLDTEDGDYGTGFNLCYDQSVDELSLDLVSYGACCLIYGDKYIRYFFKNLIKVYKEYNKKSFDYMFYEKVDDLEIIHNYGDEFIIIKNTFDSTQDGVTFDFESTYNILSCFKNKYCKKEHPLKMW